MTKLQILRKTRKAYNDMLEKHKKSSYNRFNDALFKAYMDIGLCLYISTVFKTMAPYKEYWFGEGYIANVPGFTFTKKDLTQSIQIRIDRLDVEIAKLQI